jgi:manganese/zinc/iron transport system ATP- binding protein
VPSPDHGTADSGRDATVPSRAAAESRRQTPTAPAVAGDTAVEAADLPAVDVEDLTVAYAAKPVLWDVDVAFPAGRLTAIVGPNGAGKTTLLNAVLGLVPMASGRARIFGRPYREMRSDVAYVPQRRSVDWDFPTDALDVVMMGRYGRLGWIRRPGSAERSIALDALATVGMETYANRQISELSGGQQQRVFLARALAQDARVYLMDEPFAGVDATTEAAILSLLHQLRTSGRSLVVVHHDLSTVRAYFDEVVLLNVRVIAAGRIDEVFTRANLERTYGGRIAFVDEAGI